MNLIKFHNPLRWSTQTAQNAKIYNKTNNREKSRHEKILSYCYVYFCSHITENYTEKSEFYIFNNLKLIHLAALPNFYHKCAKTTVKLCSLLKMCENAIKDECN